MKYIGSELQDRMRMTEPWSFNFTEDICSANRIKITLKQAFQEDV